MINKEILKKQILYRSSHRGTKEMDLLLGTFVKKHLDSFDESELNDLKILLEIDDSILENWYFKSINNNKIKPNIVVNKLKEFKLK
jgi:antitoxin CptB